MKRKVRSHIAELNCAGKDLVCLDERVSVNIVVEWWAFDTAYVMRKNNGFIWIIPFVSNRHNFMFWLPISYVHIFCYLYWRFEGLFLHRMTKFKSHLLAICLSGILFLLTVLLKCLNEFTSSCSNKYRKNCATKIPIPTELKIESWPLFCTRILHHAASNPTKAKSPLLPVFICKHVCL